LTLRATTGSVAATEPTTFWAVTGTTSSTATRATTWPYSEQETTRSKWDPGDGNDIVEGQDGTDTLVFNGSNADERMEVSPNGPRVRLVPNVGAITMDLNDVELIIAKAFGGKDTLGRVMMCSSAGPGTTRSTATAVTT
jgi:hypothetical protein